MTEYKRKYPSFSLCGLNCCLCPHFHTDGPSKCPGCGGNDFYQKHPSCSVITCNKKHDNVEFCFECSMYLCKKYEKQSTVDSFISYQNVLQNFKEAKNDLEKYLKDLEIKYQYLQELILNYNDGKSKGFYCIAVNLLPLCAMEEIMKYIQNDIKDKNSDIKNKAIEIKNYIESKANELNIELTLRK